MHRFFLVIILIASSFCSYAFSETYKGDSIFVDRNFIDKVDNHDFNSSCSLHDFRFLAAPAALFCGSAFARHHDDVVRDWRNDHFPNYHTSLDNVLQVAPGVLTFGLRTFGVKGHSDSWLNLLSSTALSAAISAATVEGLKNTVGRTRPDNIYERNSFPSGHTLTAFTSATILHREYGELSPWYSVGGYSVASLVGVSRILNNRHWASDVLAGAGLGIVAGNLGYIISDRIFGSQRENDFSYFDDYQGFIGLSAVLSPWGSSIPHVTGDMPLSFNRRFGYGYSIEGAYYPFSFLRINQKERAKLGIGVKTTLVYSLYEVDNDFLHSRPSFLTENCSDLTSDTDFRTQNYSFTPGVYMAFPLSDKWLVGGKGLMGWGGAFSFNVDAKVPQEDGSTSLQKVLFDEYDYGWAYELGLFCHYAAMEHLELKAQANYHATTARYTFASHAKTPDPTEFINIELGVSIPF